MFIRTVNGKKSGESYTSYRLVESVRVNNKPRQRLILNLGANFDLPKEKHKELCAIIKEKLFLGDDAPLIPREPNELDMIADSVIKKIVAKRSEARGNDKTLSDLSTTPDQADFATVDLNSLENDDVRSLGGEAICLETMNRLGIPQKLGELGFNRKQKALAIGSVIARSLAPGSDRASFHWLRTKSSLGELIEFDYNDTSLSRF